MRHVMKMEIAGRPWLIEIMPPQSSSDETACDWRYALDRDARHIRVRYTSSPFLLLAAAFAAAESIRDEAA